MKRGRGRSPKRNRIAVQVQDPSWRQMLPKAAILSRRFAAAAVGAAGPKGDAVEVSIVLADDAFVHGLNRTWRGKNKPTNVLSFPTGAMPISTSDGIEPTILGDVVVAFGTTAKEAAAQGKSLSDHLAHLVVHGVLHLLGYDHVREREAKAMERLEADILAALGIANPYAVAA